MPPSFRTSDLFSINEDDLDFERNLVRLRETKKGKRIVAVSAAFMQLCKELIALKHKECGSFEYDLWNDDPEEHKKAVFITNKGRRIGDFKTQLKTCLRFAGIPYDDPETSFTPHYFQAQFRNVHTVTVWQHGHNSKGFVSHEYEIHPK